MLLKEIDKQPQSWVPIPRRLLNLFLNGSITRGAYVLFPYLAQKANMYALVNTSIEIINSEFLKDKQLNTIQKYLYELKNHKFICFEPRQGKKSGIDIIIMDFFLPNGKITNSDNYFKENENELSKNQVSTKSEVKRSNHNMAESFLNSTTDNSRNLEFRKITSNNNDKYINKDIFNIDNKNINKTYSCRNKVSNYKPKDYEEQKIVEIAKYLEDDCLDFYLKYHLLGKFWAIEKAFIDLKEVENSKSIIDKAAWFNTHLINIIEGKTNEKSV